jgi:hypothetical protein
MRSTLDLIEQLETEAAQHFTCVLAVAFENTSVMIAANQADRLQLLTDATKQGGTPIGLIVSDKDGERPGGGTLILKAHIFPEHLENGPNEAAQRFMENVMEYVRENLERAA